MDDSDFLCRSPRSLVFTLRPHYDPDVGHLEFDSWRHPEEGPLAGRSKRIRDDSPGWSIMKSTNTGMRKARMAAPSRTWSRLNWLFQTDISRLRQPVRGRGKLRRPCSPCRAMDETKERHRATGLYGQRRSRCSDAARELHIERTWKLAPIERIRLALSLGRRLQRLRSDPDPAGTRG